MIFTNRKFIWPVATLFPLQKVIINGNVIFSNYNIENASILRYNKNRYEDGDALLVAPTNDKGLPILNEDYSYDSYVYNNTITHKSNSDVFAITTIAKDLDVFGDSRRYKEYPKPIILRTDNYSTLKLYKDLDFTTPIMEIPCSLTSKFTRIYNLVPGQTYQYKVFDTNNIAITNIYQLHDNFGEFTVLGQICQVYMPSVINIRDCGGYYTVDGAKRLKYGKIYRGAQLQPGFYNYNTGGYYNVTQHRRWLDTDPETDTKAEGGLNEQDTLEMRRLGVTLDVDLRDYNGKEKYNTQYNVWEIEKSVPFFDETVDGISHYSVSIASGNKTIVNYYALRDTSGNGPIEFRNFITKILTEFTNDGALYVHCLLGRDRTGSFIAFLLALLNINDDGILKDYELTSYCSYSGDRWSLQYSTDEPYSTPTIPANTSDFRTYVLNWAKTYAGVTEEQILQLRSLLLEDLTVSMLSSKIRTMAVLGDSQSAYSSDNRCPLKDLWWYKVAIALGLNPKYDVNNNSEGDTYVSRSLISTADMGCSWTRIRNLKVNGNDPDLIFVMMGGNDWRSSSIPLGNYTLGDPLPDTQITDGNMDFKVAYALMLKRITDTYPNATVVCINQPRLTRQTVTGHDWDEWMQAQMDVAKEFNCLTVDLCQLCGNVIYDTVSVTDNTSIYKSDIYVHLNALGHNLIFNVIYNRALPQSNNNLSSN